MTLTSRNLWINLPLNFDIYLFNWTNPCSFTADDYEKPILQQIGPYRFREIPTKTNVKWHPHNKTVSYRRKSTYFFVENESVGRLDDTIVTINALAISVAHKTRFWSGLKQRQVSMGLSLCGHQAYVVKKASQLMFDGYKDNLIPMASTMQFMGIDLNIPSKRFGWMYDRNESEESAGHFNIQTGEDDISLVGKMGTWNYASHTKYYDEPCNDVHGYAEEFYPPGQTKDRPLTIFHDELCRYLDLYFDKETEIGGVNVYKYAATEQSVDNGTEHNEHICFSSLDEDLPSGLMNVTACRYNSPIFLSFPHFYAADPYYLQFVDGLQPEKEKHEFHITVEPIMGMPVEFSARLQVNIRVQTYPNISIFHDTPTTYFPVLWFERSGRITDGMIRDIKMAGVIPTIGHICWLIIVLIGVIITLYAQFFDRMCRLKWFRKQDPLYEVEVTPTAKNRMNNECIDQYLIEQQSPLLNDDKPSGKIEIKRVHNTLESAPLAIPEPDLECDGTNV